MLAVSLTARVMIRLACSHHGNLSHTNHRPPQRRSDAMSLLLHSDDLNFHCAAELLQPGCDVGTGFT